MITEWFVGFAVDLILGLLDVLLPDISNAVPDLSGVLSGVATLNAFFPITETIGAAVFLLAVSGVMFLVKVTQTLVAHVPFIGGGGS